MSVTRENALQAAQDYVREFRPGCSVRNLLEDPEDYMASLVLDEPRTGWRVGEAFIFVKKSNGTVWTMAPGDGYDKMVGMIDTYVNPS